MFFHHRKVLFGGLAFLLVITACGPTSPAATSTFPAATAASPMPATISPTLPVATITNTPLPPTSTPTALPLKAAASPSIHMLEMLDVNNGWALTDTGVVRTADGGASWYDVTPAGLNGAPLSPFFLDAATAWLAAMGGDPITGSLYHTIDGGATWTSVAVPFGGGSLNFIDPMNGWELIGLSAGMSHEAVAVYRTSDGGASWTQVFTDDPNAAGSSDSLPLVGDKNGLIPLDNEHAWVTGAQPSDNFIYIYITQDGGQSWAATRPVPQGGFSSVASATDFFVWDGSAPLNASHDAGASWSTVTPNINIKDSMAFLQFINATTGWAITTDANSHTTIYKTTDGGATWTVLMP